MLRTVCPPPNLTISQWADEYRFLSPESAAEPGKWNTSRAEYQRGIMDAISDPSIPYVVCVKGSQLGWTEIINNTCGYYIDQDPTTLLVIQPTLELGETWSKDRFAPMIRDTPRLKPKVSDARKGDAESTLRQKHFPGGRLTIIGANAPSGLAARPIRVVIADEVDRYPLSAGTEGDPLALAAKRQTTFWNKKTLVGSTPLHKQTSIIWREWERSDQRRYHVPCPSCGHEQYLQWAQVRWDKAQDGTHQPQTAHYVCEECGAIWNDIDRWDAIKRGRWKAEKKFEGIAGFHVPGMLSSWLTLANIVKEFLDSRKDAQLLQVWTNTVLGDVWEQAYEEVQGAGLMRRIETYDPDVVPDGVRLITAGVDVQVNRIEVQIIGWGIKDESWVLDYNILRGDPAQREVWDDLDQLFKTIYTTENGRRMNIRSACVDSGGHHTQEVYQYCARRWRRRIYATKGMAGTRVIWPKQASRTKSNYAVFVIGVDTAKDMLYGRLRIEKPGPGYVHFPTHEAIDSAYFSQLTAERVMTKKRNGIPYRVWELPEGRRNEALDTFVLALAAKTSLRVRIEGPAREPPPKQAVIDAEDAILENPTELPPDKHPIRPQTAPPKETWFGDRRGWFDRY